MRNLVLFILGMALGAAGAAIVVNTLDRRDAYPRGIMDVMQHHYAFLQRTARAGRCGAQDRGGALAVLGELTDGIETAFYDNAAPAVPFREYTQRLRGALSVAVAAQTCAELSAALDRIGATCEACHQQYR